VSVYFSLPFLTKEKSNPFEPYTPVPEVRFNAMKQIADAGIPVGIAIAPVIPGYNESDIPGLLERAKESGATRAFMSMLHIDSDSIEEYFVAKMNERLPETRVKKILNTMKRERGGKLQHESYKARMTGRTEQWDVTQKLFEFHIRRLGFNQDKGVKQPDDESANVEQVQQRLF
jgi:DNA repair photolyase